MKITEAVKMSIMVIIKIQSHDNGNISTYPSNMKIVMAAVMEVMNESNHKHQRRIQDPVERLRWSFLRKQLTAGSCYLFS